VPPLNKSVGMFLVGTMSRPCMALQPPLNLVTTRTYASPHVVGNPSNPTELHGRRYEPVVYLCFDSLFSHALNGTPKDPPLMDVLQGIRFVIILELEFLSRLSLASPWPTIGKGDIHHVTKDRLMESRIKSDHAAINFVPCSIQSNNLALSLLYLRMRSIPLYISGIDCIVTTLK
jgi:hypothetical protein